MKVIQPNCRAQFTPADIDFVVSVLSVAGDRAQCLISLFSDLDSLNTILDDELIFRALTEHNNCLKVSKYFYFYVLVRHVLLRSRIDDRNVTDYIAAMLAEFSSIQRVRYPTNENHPMDYLVDMLAALQKADDSTKFLIRAHVGNHSLFISGVFPDHIHHRTQFRGAPEMEYYENLGSANFGIARDHRLAHQFELSPIFGMLAERFRTVRMALNDMSDRLLFLRDQDYSLETLLRQAQDQSLNKSDKKSGF